MDFIALDVETAQGKRWSICQIGICIVENGVIKETITELVQPPNNEYFIRNIQIHGITPEMTQYISFFPSIWNKIYPIIQSQIIVAHNASFDMSCLRQTLGFYNMEIPEFDYDCTYTKTGLKLNQACVAYGIDLNNHHDAGCDAEACAKLYLKLLNREAPEFTKIKPPSPKRNPFQGRGHDALAADILKPDLSNADPDNPFFNKKVVFTGVLKTMERKQAAISVKNMGADIDTAISKRTNYVITGSSPGPSKLKKIANYNDQGCDIKMISEGDFLDMLNGRM